MACHEIAALRLGMMNLLGIDNEAEKQHELDELGPLVNELGPIRSLTESVSMKDLHRYFESRLHYSRSGWRKWMPKMRKYLTTALFWS